MKVRDEIIRAVRQGMDAARFYGKLAPSPYHNRHKLFQAWWEALVVKADCPDWSERRVINHVLPRLKYK